MTSIQGGHSPTSIHTSAIPRMVSTLSLYARQKLIPRVSIIHVRPFKNYYNYDHTPMITFVALKLTCVKLAR